jgi:hypothetical protein
VGVRVQYESQKVGPKRAAPSRQSGFCSSPTTLTVRHARRERVLQSLGAGLLAREGRVGLPLLRAEALALLEPTRGPCGEEAPRGLHVGQASLGLPRGGLSLGSELARLLRLLGQAGDVSLQLCALRGRNGEERAEGRGKGAEFSRGREGQEGGR